MLLWKYACHHMKHDARLDFNETPKKYIYILGVRLTSLEIAFNLFQRLAQRLMILMIG